MKEVKIIENKMTESRNLIPLLTFLEMTAKTMPPKTVSWIKTLTNQLVKIH